MTDRIHIVQFKLEKNAHLPFHLLAYGQLFIKKHNCNIFYTPELRKNARFPEVFEICDPIELLQGNQQKIKQPINQHGPIVFTRVSPFYEQGDTKELEIRYAYFTEADQILHIESMDILYGIASVTNKTTFILPRRREKQYPSIAKEYNNHLSLGRHCGCLTCDCSFEFNILGRKQIIFKPTKDNNFNIAPDNNFIYCN